MRRALDFYPTPAWATRILLDRCPQIRGRVLECCCGKGDISQALAAKDTIRVLTNDIDRRCAADSHADATGPRAWQQMNAEIGPFDWVVSNPPFSLAPVIVPLTLRYAVRGIAMLLRLSYLEPCHNRQAWLTEHDARGRVLVLPRISFTGDGKTDNVTAAWLIVGEVEHGWEVVATAEAERHEAMTEPTRGLFDEASA
jgi:hypothetical protein